MKVGIVGCGLVGSTAAYAMVMAGIGREIVLVDRDSRRSSTEADDISHAVPFSKPLRVISGSYADLQGSSVVIIAAGVREKPGESRTQYLRSNSAVFREIVPGILTYAPDAVLVIATSPVDVMTNLAARYASEQGVPTSRVLGTGTTIDTARFRSLLGQYLKVDPQYLNGYVLGEHGDSEVLTWSLVTVGGMPLRDFCRLRGIELTPAARDSIEGKVRGVSNAIIEGKGAIYFGIGSALARIVDVILTDQRAILTVSTPLPESWEGANVTISLPHLVGGAGILETFPLSLTYEEQEALHASAGVVRDAIRELDALI
jgi:L-lactate dehydrogenase